MDIDDKFDIRDAFQIAFSKLVAEHLDKCDSEEDVAHLEAMLQDCTSVYGSGWRKNSTKFNL